MRHSRETYYEKALKDGSHTAILVYDKDQIIGAGGISYFRDHADLSQPDRKESLYYEYVYKSGIPAKRDCIPDAEFTGGGCKEQRNCAISLEATEMGRPLYEKFGFTGMMMKWN